MGIGLANVQQIGPILRPPRSLSPRAKRNRVIAQGNHRKAVISNASATLNFSGRVLRIGEDVTTTAQQRRHPGTEIEGLQGLLRMADRPQIVHHHHLRDVLRAEIPFGRGRKDQGSPLVARQPGKLRLVPDPTTYALQTGSPLTSRNKPMRHSLQRRQHGVGIGPDARGLSQNRGVIDQQHWNPSGQTNQSTACVLEPVQEPTSGTGQPTQMPALSAIGFGIHLNNARMANPRLHHLEDRITAVHTAQ